MAHVRTEKEHSDELVTQVRKESEQRMLHLNVSLIGRNRAEKLTNSLVKKSVNGIDTVVQQLGFDAVSRL